MNKKINHLDLVGFKTPEEAYRKVKEWSSNLSDDEHFIRSVIFDIHAGIEILFRQIFYHFFKPIIFETGKEEDDKEALGGLEKMVEDLSFGNMYRILWPILEYWPYDLTNISSLNNLRNQVAHGNNIDKVNYRGKNPFTDADCFTQVFVDAWVVKKELTKFFHRRITDQQEDFKRYYKAYQELQELKNKK